MSAKEAQARPKLNKLLEETGWYFFNNTKGQVNIVLEPNVELLQKAVGALDNDFESSAIHYVCLSTDTMDYKTAAQKVPLSNVAAEAVEPRGAVMQPIMGARSIF